MFRKSSAALLAAVLLLGGCSSAAPKKAADSAVGSEVKMVSTICKGEEGQETMTVYMEAPGEDEVVTNMSITVSINTVEDDDVDPQEMIDTVGEELKTQIAEGLGAEAENVTFEVEGDILNVLISIPEPKDFMQSLLGEEVTDEDLIFKNAKKDLAAAFTCE